MQPAPPQPPVEDKPPVKLDLAPAGAHVDATAPSAALAAPSAGLAAHAGALASGPLLAATF